MGFINKFKLQLVMVGMFMHGALALGYGPVPVELLFLENKARPQILNAVLKKLKDSGKLTSTSIAYENFTATVGKYSNTGNFKWASMSFGIVIWNSNHSKYKCETNYIHISDESDKLYPNLDSLVECELVSN